MFIHSTKTTGMPQFPFHAFDKRAEIRTQISEVKIQSVAFVHCTLRMHFNGRMLNWSIFPEWLLLDYYTNYTKFSFGKRNWTLTLLFGKDLLHIWHFHFYHEKCLVHLTWLRARQNPSSKATRKLKTKIVCRIKLLGQQKKQQRSENARRVQKVVVTIQ